MPVRKFGFALALLLTAIPQLAAAESLRALVGRLGAEDCPDSALTCVDLAVPVDRAQPGSNRTITVRFAVNFAAKKSRGILFYAVGGPGGSGLAVADSYLASFDKRLTENMDVIFFDQRGVGPLNGIACPKAGLAFDTTTFSLDRPEAAIAAAKSFAESCAAETPHAELLPYLSTDDAVQDLEDFRQAIGAPKIWLYGESYGTQFAQVYAARYPQALKGLILDGVLDLTRDATAFYGNDVRSAEKLLAKTFAACDALAECHADMGAPAGAVYDALAAKLAAAPQAVDYPLASGRFAKREMTAAILETNAFYALYGTDSRMSFLRALAASTQGNFVPLLRLDYDNLGVDPETAEPDDDPTWYGGAYYGITCPDFDDAGQDPVRHTQEILDRARRLAPEAPRLIRDFYAERLACSFWPVPGRPQRPAAFPGGDYPTLLLNSDSDPATPVDNGYAVFDQAKNAYMVTMQGGPHVIWGRGLDCPDRIVFGLMLDGRKPEKREQLCKQDFMDPYVPLTAASTGNALGLAQAIEAELGQSRDLANWDAYSELTFGCDFGGTLTVNAARSGVEYSFGRCALWPGLAVSGSGVSIDADGGTRPDGLTLDVKVSGAHRGEIVYRHDSTTEARSVSGSFDGREIATPRPLP
ncbi:alpha/beta fold hydrolase [Dongia sp.]|uniref:alpha/beta fold hydrolase n=1 Tax=Dongia sp. TaxID=1977262 RepID=UPI00374FF201